MIIAVVADFLTDLCEGFFRVFQKIHSLIDLVHVNDVVEVHASAFFDLLSQVGRIIVEEFCRRGQGDVAVVVFYVGEHQCHGSSGFVSGDIVGEDALVRS